jgi:hypothetical protein
MPDLVVHRSPAPHRAHRRDLPPLGRSPHEDPPVQVRRQDRLGADYLPPRSKDIGHIERIIDRAAIEDAEERRAFDVDSAEPGIYQERPN